MTQFNFTYDPNVSLEQRLGFEMAAAIWSKFLTDDVTLNLHIGATTGLNDNQAVGGAVPIFHEVNYGVYQQYLQQDATSAQDAMVVDALQEGNTVDFLIDTDGDPTTASELVDGNTTIMITRAQAKALGMEKALVLNNGSTWNRDVLADPTALDGYIVINNSYNWGYDLTRQAAAAPDTLDFLTMALHEIGHSMGFVSGLDGLLETFTMHSGETRAEGFTALDLLRYSKTSVTVDNPDGSVSDLSFGGAAYFSMDGGQTATAEFEEGNEYQASHWQRYQNAIGIMDPTLGYTERTNISKLDLQAFDVLGWDVDYAAFAGGLDLNALYQQALAAVSNDFSVGVAEVEGAIAKGQDWYSLARGTFWEALKTQMIAQGYGDWWSEFEKQLNLGSGSWWQELDQQMLELGSGSWWQIFKNTVLELGSGGWWLGSGSWWQQFETKMLALGSGSWWQVFEPEMLKQGFGGVWQVFEKQMFALGYGDQWQDLEAKLFALGSGSWWQAFEDKILALGSGSWWQVFEETILELGSGSWWQEFQDDLLQLGSGSWWLGSGSWWQVFELGSGSWWLEIEEHLDELSSHNSSGFNANSTTPNAVTGGESDDILAGGLAGDLISGKAGDDLIDGKAGNDLLLGDAGNDIVYGWDGNDTLYGGEGNDLLTGEDGNDYLDGEAGHDILSGGRGSDVLIGGAGRDVLKGDTEDDLLDGGDGDDKLSGGSGNDLLVGGLGQDSLDGGDGNDILYGDTYVAQSSNTSNTSNSTVSYAQVTDVADFWVRIEAEDLQLINYNVDSFTGASGNKVVVTKGQNSKARTTFSGPEGTYDLIVGYYDLAGDTATLTLRVGNGVNSTDYVVQLNGATGLRSFKIAGVTLASGTKIEIQGNAVGSDLAIIDYLDILTAGTTPRFDATGAPVGQLNLMLGTQGEGSVKRIEAESLVLAKGYQVVKDNQASGDAVIRTTGSYSTATYTHTGEAGTFNLYANYFDDKIGEAEVKVFLNDEELTEWKFEQNNNASHERLLGLNVVLNPGDVIKLEGKSHYNDQAIVDYLVLEQVSAASSSVVPITGGRIEVENMSLGGKFKIEGGNNFASNFTIVKSEDEVTGFTATTQVGTTGLYDIVIGYYDENDGAARYNAVLAGNQLATWTSTLDLGDGNASTKSFITKTIRGVLINGGDRFQIQSIQAGGDRGYLDYVEFLPHNPTPVIRVEAEQMRISGDYDVKDFTFASRGRTVQSKSTDVAKTVNLNTTFDSPAGRYNLVVGYYDENDGLAKFTTSVNGVQRASWVANANLGSKDVSMQTFTTRTITGLELNPGDTIRLTALRENSDEAQVDYIEFVPVVLGQDKVLQVEVEQMNLSGKASIKTEKFAYGGAFVETDDGKTGFRGTTLFTGESGYYKVIVGYYDDNEGAAEIVLKVDNKQVDRWYADQNFGSNRAEFASFTTRVASQAIYIDKTDLIEIQAIEGDNDRGNLDYIQFIAVDAPVTRPAETVTVNPADIDADIIRGGAGNDTAYGGQGNDILYGDAGNDVLYGDYGNGNGNNASVSNSSTTLSFQQGVNGYAGTIDTFIAGTSSWATESYGSATTINVDGDEKSAPIQGLIRFENIFGTQTGQIATNATITSAVLQLQVQDAGNAIAVHNMLQTWSGSSTWKSLNTGGEGIQVGIETATNATAITGNIGIGTLEIDVTASLKAWQQDPTKNYGWALLPTGTDGVNFYSAEGIIKPKLLVNVGGGSGTTTVSGAGNDILTGGSGNDTLNGEGGNDTLTGTDGVARGIYERDVLLGGAGADKFVLGDAQGAYYLGGGSTDFAVIQDFTAGTDKVQLYGSAANYTTTAQGSDTLLSYGQDLVAQFTGVTSLNLASSSFQFV
ncbi:MAG: NF038122 family metalloprotease [Prochlorotrichaceae cyanobacterium]